MTNTPPLSWINTEIDRALGVVHESLGRHSAGADAAVSLAACPVHLRQASGALRMGGLAAAAAVCEVIEAGFAKLGQRPSPESVAAIDQAVVALKEFVAGLARGEAECAMRLLPRYREVADLAGRTDASEKDLFFPDPSIVAPPHRRPKRLPAATVEAFVKKQRALFQRGLLDWLRDNPTGLEEMRRAVNQLHKIGEQLPGPQAIWWVANGMLDALAGSESPGWVAAAKALGTRLERQMSSGAPAASDSLLREILYAVARCQTVSPRISQVRDLYRLDSLFPEKRVLRDSIDLQLLPRFLEEAREIVPSLGSHLRDWKADPADEKASGALRLLLHALKGSARMAGAMRLGELCHLMEARIAEALEAKQFPAGLFEFLQERIDRISADVERMGAAAGMRVNAELLERLINEAGEVAVARSHIEAELRSMRRQLAGLNESIARLRGQLREVEAAADSTRLQELARLMTEGLDEVDSIQQAVATSLGHSDGLLAEQDRITRDVQRELIRVRAVG
jgi:HPt (histidine-containing phosphotransfer) domain-containing protein